MSSLIPEAGKGHKSQKRRQIREHLDLNRVPFSDHVTGVVRTDSKPQRDS